MIVTEEFVIVTLVPFTPPKVAPAATVRAPVPSVASEPSCNVPSLTFTAPVLVHLPVTVILPVPTLVNREFSDTTPANEKLPSLPACQVFAPEPPLLLNEA